jgi:LDH2 family malate/lactate/ureidoglycolate dehydrogenase
MAEPGAASDERVPADTVRRQIEAVLSAWGMRGEPLRITAQVMVETDLLGIDSHGVSMLILYDKMQTSGQLRPDAEPRIVRESASTALIDAGAGLGHYPSVKAMQLAIDKAKAHDIGVVSVFNSHHHGALRIYAEMAAREGLVAMVASSSRIVTQVPTFGAERVLGTNPFAFAAPCRRHPPVVLDIATSVVAANKVKVYAFAGKDIPEGWVIDGEGRDMTDSEAAYRLLFSGGDGGLNPIGGDGKDLGGHKGYGLAVFAQIFASTLGGGSFSPIRNRTQKPGDPDNIGHFFMALNPEAFRPREDFLDDMDALADTLRATRPADPRQPVLVPGDPEIASRTARERDGIPIPASLRAVIRDIAASAGAAYVLGG